MRRAIKPFKKEIKGKSRKPAKPSALFADPEFEADERPPRDVNDDLAGQHEGSYEEALRAADAVFGGSHKPEPAMTPSATPAEPEKRILSDLTYVDPLEARLAAAPPRRGRKPGTKNKPKAPTVASAIETAPAAPMLAAPNITKLVFKRRAPGFLQQLAARRALKPGEKWKLKMRTRAV